jgi:hypothetical protein
VKNAFVILQNEIGKGCEFPYFIEIIDKTTLVPDFGELEKNNTLKGIFCRKVREEMEKHTPDSEEYKVLSLALKYGLSALEDRSVVDYTGGDR